jgi:hypothetical protein
MGMKGLEGIEGCAKKPHCSLHYKHKIFEVHKGVVAFQQYRLEFKLSALKV